MSIGVVFKSEFVARIFNVNGECTQDEHFEPRDLVETPGGANRKR